MKLIVIIIIIIIIVAGSRFVKDINESTNVTARVKNYANFFSTATFGQSHQTENA